MSRIPKVLHYCFGLSANFGNKPWSLVHYVCVRSAIERVRPEKTLLYYEYEPRGPWWELTKSLLQPVAIKAPREIFGRPVHLTAHRADVVRLQVLLEHGGIYLDADVFVHRDFDDLLDNSFVISQEGQIGLSNAALLSEPGACFAKRWYEEYHWFRGDRSYPLLIEHSIVLPLELSKKFPHELTVLPHTSFCWPLHHSDHLKWIFEPEQRAISTNVYGHHLWESLSWAKYLEHLTPRHVREIESNFHKWARPFLVDLPDDYGTPLIVEKLKAKVRNLKNRGWRG